MIEGSRLDLIFGSFVGDASAPPPRVEVPSRSLSYRTVVSRFDSRGADSCCSSDERRELPGLLAAASSGDLSG